MQRLRYAAPLAGLVLLAGCTGSPQAAPTPSATPTPLSALDASGLVVARASFCERVSATAVAAAVGAGSASPSAYGEGDRVALGSGVTDVSGEFGCTWTAGAAVARAWVFSPPISPQRARGLVSVVGSAAGCRAVSGPAYGAPSVATVCTDDGVRTAAYAGLFGDAWLGCSVSGSGTAAALRQRAGAWCVAVADAASGG